MAIIIFLQDRSGKLLKELGAINDDDLISLTDMATEKKLRCFPFIDAVGDTILNNKQLRELTREIDLLKKTINDNQQKYLSIIDCSVKEALKDSSIYLIFKGECNLITSFTCTNTKVLKTFKFACFSIYYRLC